MAKSIKEVRRDELLATVTQEVIEKANHAAANIDGFDASDGPITSRLSRGAVSFCDALAAELNVSRSRAIQLCVEFVSQSVVHN
ncbi:hypothetical protein NFI99_12655 (plasmid) [Burkholderia glumae]|uniref:Uncharacterized protein n=1 Tax=Burkholderia glumae TaxID=337 RepID=A0ABY5BEW2_BURGL|nr:hypothetical protein [Burkholderia glumae]USS44136.1 hypothetical protein NFI99_12655 [Burkholderia glumae]